MLPKHARHEGLRQIEHQLVQHHKHHGHLTAHTLGREHGNKIRELEKMKALPDANIPKVVSFPAS